MQTIDNTDLTPTERHMTAAAINHFGSGWTPFADDDTLPFFERVYAADCLTKLLASGKLTTVGLAAAESARTKITAE